MKTIKPAKFFALLTLAALAAALPASATTVFYDFNDSDNLGWDGVTNEANELFYTTDGGLNDSGAVFRNDSDGRNAFMVTQSSFDGNLGPMTMSFFFQAGRPGRNEDDENRASQMGFRTDQVWGNSGTGKNIDRLDQSPNSVFVSMFPRTNSNINLGIGTSEDNRQTVSGELTLVESNWYYWTSTFTQAGQDTWNITSEIFASDDTGTIGTLLLTAQSAPGIKGPDMDDFGTVYGSIGIGENDPGGRDSIRTIDNVIITVVPEPGTLVLVGIALGSLFFFRRRR